jgi:hypothetical protein
LQYICNGKIDVFLLLGIEKFRPFYDYQMCWIVDTPGNSAGSNENLNLLIDKQLFDNAPIIFRQALFKLRIND